MNQPGTCNLTGKRGDTFHAHIVMTNKDGVVLELPEGEWRAQIRERADIPRILAEFEVVATNTSIRLTLPAAEAAKISTAVWDLEYSGNDIVKTYLEGTFILSQDVTR